MYTKAIKPALDFVISIIMLPVLGAIALVLGLAIYLDDKGPAFYVSDRIGRHGKVYRMYKFRRMMVNAPDIRLPDGSTYNGEDDPRLTRMGRWLRKTSLDELPQLLNILKGDMSLIGPRPDPPDWMERYPVHILPFLNVKPGITGYSQAYFRNSIDSTEKMENDLYYAEHISFPLDVRIFFKTIATVVTGDNVYIKSGGTDA